MGIDNSDNLNKFSDGISSYFSHGERVNFFNELPTETKDRIISNNFKIFYGKAGVMIHDKIYLLSDEETNEYRVITGSANFSKSAFDSSNKNFENIRIDDSKKIYDLYSARFDYLLTKTDDYIPERCRRKYKETKTLLVINPDTEIQLLVDDVQENKVPLHITQEQFEILSERIAKNLDDREDLRKKKLISEIIFDKKGSDGKFKLKKLPDILKKKIVLRDNLAKTSVKKLKDSDCRETLLMQDDFKIYKQAPGTDDMYLYSEPADKNSIKTTLEKINSFTHSYCEFTLTPSPEIAAKIYELILYAFTSPFIWKIRQKCAIVYDKSSVADIPMFFIMGGIRQIMDNFIINGVKVSEEQFNRIKNIPQLSDEEIDYSDIPPLTDEELARMKPARLREKNLKVAS